MGEQQMALRNMGLAALAFLGIAILSVLGIIVLEQFKQSSAAISATPNATTNPSQINNTIDAWIAAIVIFGTFATIIALVIVTKVIIDIVKTLQA